MKMGKSLGNTLEPNELVEKFGSDAVRYFFLREVEFGSDGDYAEDRFINIVNAHLANTIGIMNCNFFFLEKLQAFYWRLLFDSLTIILEVSLAGNLLNRTLGLLKKNCQSTLVVDSTAAADGNAFKDKVEELVKVYLEFRLVFII